MTFVGGIEALVLPWGGLGLRVRWSGVRLVLGPDGGDPWVGAEVHVERRADGRVEGVAIIRRESGATRDVRFVVL